MPDPLEPAVPHQSLKTRRGVAKQGLIGTLAVFLLAVLVLWLAQRRRLGLYDEGIMLTGGWLVGQGRVPYRDFYYMYGPAPLYLIALTFKAFGTSVLTVRALDCAIKALLVLLLRRLSVIAAGRRAEWPVTVVALVWMAGIASYNYPVWLSASMAASAILLLLRGTRRSELAGGAIAGLSLMARYDLGLGSVAALGCVLAWKKASEAGSFSLRAAVRDVLPFAAGVALVAVPMIIGVFAMGMTGEVIEDLVVLQLRYYSSYRRLDWPGAEVNEDLIFYFPVLVAVLALSSGAVFAKERDTTQPGADRAIWAVRFLCLLVLAFFMKGIVRKSAIHVSTALMMALPLAAATARRVLGNWRGAKMPVKALFGLSVLVLAVPSAVVGVDAVMKSSALPALPGEAMMEGLLVPADLRGAVALVDARTRPDEPIFIGTTHSDRAFVNDLSAYFLARRVPATRWHTYDAGLHASAPVQSAIIGDLERTGTRIALVSRAYEQVREPNLSAVSSGVTLLDRYLAEQFRVIGVFGVYSVLERVPAK